jgi:hypothetical protein
MVVKRCQFCAHTLDANGLCQNQKCADYERTKIIETAEKSRIAKVNTASTATS